VIACGNLHVHHLLNTQPLGAQLNLVGVVELRSTALVLDRSGPPPPGSAGQGGPTP
jgi:hypothetical protein